ncbi:MAG: type II toxin-antitoxin system VapC family toxin [Candidatus Aenigmarchaeota archaeon]|nr:type II toxin-antitoxin system VapC family toxin [Candidatus Aenigmarchaeota archaeon]
MILQLDTSILIDLENGQKPVIGRLEELKGMYPALPTISFMTYFEFLYGLRKKRPHNQNSSLAFLENFDVIQTTKRTASVLSLLKERYGLPFSDLFIAAQAIENNMMLVTKDADFERIEELNKIVV